MTNKHTVRPSLETSPILPKHFFLKGGIADGQHLIDQEDFRFQMSGDGEGEAHVHAARVLLDRSVDELFEFGEGNDFIKLPSNFPSVHSEYGAIEIDILMSRQLGMKTSPHFKK